MEELDLKCKKNRNKCCCCKSIITTIYAILFTFTLGLILGAVFGIGIIIALPAVITLAVVFFVLLISNLILQICCCGMRC